MRRLTSSAIIALLSAGCAKNPNVTFSYYPVKWNSAATVTQTVACNAAKNRVVVLNSADVKTAYSSNTSATPSTIYIKDFDAVYADSEFTVEFTEDGRLKSINQSTTGQGEAIVKSAVTFAAALATFAVLEAKPIPECKTIETWGGGKPVTLTYRNTTDIEASTLGKTVELVAAPESEPLRKELQAYLPLLNVEVGLAVPMESRVQYHPAADAKPEDKVLVDLQKTNSVTMTFNAKNPTTHKVDVIGKTTLVVPDAKIDQVPIPRAALFGKQGFTLSLSEAGIINSIGYVKTSGSAGALNALGTIATTQTPTTKAAELKAEADLIAAQQRLTQCKAKPEECK